MPRDELTLEALGWDRSLEAAFDRFRQKNLLPGRIAVEDKHYYVVIAPQGEWIGQITGKLHHQAKTPADLPKVGDWVAVAPLPGEAKAVIHHVLERRTKLSRKDPGRDVAEQILATNVDRAFAVQALDQRFNPALLRRHLVTVFESGAQPVIVLNKADLCPDIPDRIAQAKAIAADVPIVVASAKTGQGLPELNHWIHAGETVVFIGSSGVGKSTLINDLCGEEVQATAEVRESDSKGRHVTSWRELILLPQGGLVIDTPGMREFQMWMADEGMGEAFADIDGIALQCHFRDCTHTVEKRCAVLGALAEGRLTPDRHAQYVKLKKELSFLANARTKHAWIQRKRQGKMAQRAMNRFKRDQVK